MDTLYININGESIQSTDNITVVETKDAIINKFYFELGKGIIGDIMARGIANVKRIGIVKDFANHEGYCEILDQWEKVKMVLLGKAPEGTMKITLPKEYITWLNNNGIEAYSEIAKSLYYRKCVVEISIDNIYTNIGSVLNLINDKKNYGEFVVNDNAVTDESAISVEIRKRIGENIPFLSFEEWEERMTKDSENNGKPIDQSEKVSKDSKTPGRYNEIQSFHEGMAVVRKGDKYGFIDINGEEVIPCKYENARRFSEGLALVNDNIFIKHNGVIELKVLSEDLKVVGDFHDGMCRVVSKSKNSYGFVDKTGFLKVGCKYSDAHDYSCGYATVWVKGNESSIDDHSRVIGIDTKGQVIDDWKYYSEKYGDDSKSYTYNASDYARLDSYLCRFEQMINYYNGSRYKSNRITCCNKLFKSLDLPDNFVLISFLNGIAFGINSPKNEWYWTGIGCEGYLDNRKYKSWGSFSKEGLQPFKNNYSEVWGYISTENEIVVDFQYEEARIHSEGLAAVCKDGRWGYIDAKGKVVIPFSYSKATEFSEGRAVVETGGIVMIIDNKGKQIV